MPERKRLRNVSAIILCNIHTNNRQEVLVQELLLLLLTSSSYY